VTLTNWAEIAVLVIVVVLSQRGQLQCAGVSLGIHVADTERDQHYDWQHNQCKL